MSRIGNVFALLLIVSTANCFMFLTADWISEIFGFSSGQEAPINEEAFERIKRQSSGGDECGSEPFISCSSTLPQDPDQPADADGQRPINFRFMPTLANGHIGFIPYNPVMYMSGLYSGTGGESHRAKIPSIIIGKIELSAPELERRTVRRYRFNAKEGTFTEMIETEFAHIEHRMYVHQMFTKVLISDIKVTKKRNINSGGSLRIAISPFPDEGDILFEETDFHHGNRKLTGRTTSAETPGKEEEIHIFYTEPLTGINVIGSDKREIFVLSVDRQHSAAQNEFDRALQILSDEGADQLLQLHIDAWEATWNFGRLEVEDNIFLEKLVNFAQYYLLSNLPAMDPYQDPQRDEYHFGVARSSLGHGSRGKNHQGHIMWDSEVYVLPAVLPFHPQLAKKMLRYRCALADAARNNARARGEHGYRFPWESGILGGDVTPDGTCNACRDRQIHVSGAVAFGIRQYYSATRDRDFITNQDYRACDVMREIAKFYGEKAKYDNKRGRYSIRDVMGPDDYHDHVDDNAYTNVVASLAIHYARYLSCMCGRNARQEVPDNYTQMALYFDLPYNNEKRLHYAFDGYQGLENKTIKQADTLLLAYPLNWNMSRDILKNDLEYYETLINDRSPAMTLSFMSVGWKFAEDYTKTESYFIRSYQDYLEQPFKVWKEYNEASREDRQRSTVNFLPGMGGFLQSVIYGYAGVRIRPEALEFHNPMVPPRTTGVVLHRMKYLEAEFTVRISQSQSVTIQVHHIGDYPLVLQHNSTGLEESMNTGAVITVPQGKKGFFIYTTAGTPCEHPRDYVYMPWGYSPWINTGNSLIFAHHGAVYYGIVLVTVYLYLNRLL